MDRTLTRAKRGNRRRQRRNWNAWQRFSPDGKTCRHCPHDNTTHISTSGQPHFYRKATYAEKADPKVILYYHDDPDAGRALVRRMVVARNAELITTYCTACAEKIGTEQVMCYQRTLATGEVMGL